MTLRFAVFVPCNVRLEMQWHVSGYFDLVFSIVVLKITTKDVHSFVILHLVWSIVEGCFCMHSLIHLIIKPSI